MFKEPPTALTTAFFLCSWPQHFFSEAVTELLALWHVKVTSQRGMPSISLHFTFVYRQSTSTGQAKSCAWSSLNNIINCWYSKLKKCEVKCFPKCVRQIHFYSSVACGVFSSSCLKVFEEDVFLKQNFILRCTYFEDSLLIRAWSILILKYFCFIVCWTMVPVSYISHYVRLGSVQGQYFVWC